MNRLKVVIIFGGRSVEHEASVISTRSIMKFINRQKYEVIPIGITVGGLWVETNEADKFLNSKKKLLVDRGSRFNQIPKILQSLPKNTVVLPLMECTTGEDGVIQGFLELDGLPYVGTGVFGSALCIDKVKLKEILQFHNLPVAPFYWFRTTDKLDTKLVNNFPLFVKPARLGGSIGISRVNNNDELQIAVRLASQYDNKIIVENGLDDIREIEVLVVGNNSPRCFIIGEAITNNKFQDYEAKSQEQRQLVAPAKLSTKIKNRIKRAAIKAYQVSNCAGYARVDIFLRKEGDKFWVGEITTKPSFNKTESYLKAAGRLDEYQGLINQLIQLAVEMWQKKQRLKTSL
ncbi:MAG: D-alanine-D-alanine ligase [Candidatus Beckwithbacteria bacterium GW2011_GWB1_47_15]|uniref:D-alanine--D-alanine ligase n=1 Tax=Candidatus Beckwithbacteria bacterium GW2011_GWB1_47_15 TaxID=1618371 RepID=A0A0G1RXK1_9BACT|nr:MAG: D-alanine--D-alanine ligase, D-alanine-D-alanine ligase [Candidatus Beckwithbacteria bacterium GW2011_GWC1_49_16]AQS30921.1 hypothetical protein [uncultured bacterium]KKU36105.1 MAG: D-alanine-D-alanine ligase [Candidatus Beckwithbacteria bacterium GW2011_GWA1_46_30]KKU62069.1 MAG: D-alanine-D-alanine ligase [Candidatus Beckwithbacteria bacterium GW2011_GWB1_47_15]KKU72378.1 MAG: D-alanine-D-alanine ligase [Candidatus Beckwithbacteria bacterium GW2011_GWA2_47_25]OGD49285.1 MAG: hypothe